MTVVETLTAVRRAGRNTPADERAAAPSVAAIGKHPIHPTLVPFPIAFLVATLGSDLAYWRTRDPFWARASSALLKAGLASGAAAATAGAVDYLSIPRARKHSVGPLHALGNTVVLGLAAANLATRRRDPEADILPRGLALSAATAALLGLTAWAGGELIYRHRVGVAEADPPAGGHGADGQRDGSRAPSRA